jgi:hypothetical protein
MLGEVEDQDRAHAVIGEALPHLGEEEHVQALRMPGELLFFLNGDLNSNGQERDQEEKSDSGDPVAFLPETDGLHEDVLCYGQYNPESPAP